MPKTKTIRSDVHSPAVAEGYHRWQQHLGDGASTTIHLAIYSRRRVLPRVAVFPEAERLLPWCRKNNIRHAMTGGFFSRRSKKPLGRTWVEGMAIEAEPFGKHWADERGGLHLCDGQIAIAPQREMPSDPIGDLLTASPILLRRGVIQVGPDSNFEGLQETWRGEMDDDWTNIRAARTAFGYNRNHLFSLVCDGYVTAPEKFPDDLTPPQITDVGLHLLELAQVMKDVGATDALNLDGGGGSTLVYDQTLVNNPLAGAYDTGHEMGQPLPEGRAIHTALAFLPR